MLWRFRRSGGKGAYTEYTKPFAEFPGTVRDVLRDASGLSPDEIPVIASVFNERTDWVLLTTDRLIWCTAGETSSIPWSSLHKIAVPPEELEPLRPGRPVGPGLCRLRIWTTEDSVHEIEFEPGPPFIGFSNTLAVLASQSRLRRS